MWLRGPNLCWSLEGHVVREVLTYAGRLEGHVVRGVLTYAGR